MDEKALREEIRQRLKRFAELKESQKRFVPGKSKVQYSGAVFGDAELSAVVDSLLDGWFGVGKNALRFEEAFAKMLSVHSSVLANSGSSANLLAVTALMNRQLKNCLKPGDEVITVAATFPTTLNPIIQNNLVPVFLDVQLGTYNLDPDNLGRALGERTRAIMLPHTLGNPNDMDAIMQFAAEHGLFVIEDAADALGSSYAGKPLGSFGELSTFSFYPAHHITLGEGGAVAVKSGEMEAIVRSLRDWGRACACRVCTISLEHDSKCPFRFKKTWEGLPEDYDTKYIYTNIGYNLKPLELQAAMGLQQLKRLPDFVKARKRNFERLFGALSCHEDKFVLPESLAKADPCWFAFPLTVRENAGLKRKEILRWLEENNIENRLLFSGNILRHPAYKNIKCRVSGSLENSDAVMQRTFFVGVWPGLTDEMLDFVVEKFEEFLKRH